MPVGEAEHLLTQKPDLTRKDKNGNSPLYLAVSRGDSAVAMVKQLLDAGAPVEFGPKMGDNAGATALHIYCATDANACLEALLSRSASAAKLLPRNSTPLHTAARGVTWANLKVYFHSLHGLTEATFRRSLLVGLRTHQVPFKVAETWLHDHVQTPDRKEIPKRFDRFNEARGTSWAELTSKSEPFRAGTGASVSEASWAQQHALIRLANAYAHLFTQTRQRPERAPKTTSRAACFKRSAARTLDQPQLWCAPDPNPSATL